MNNNDVSQEKKDSVMKSLAIAGFIGIVVLIAWLSIQIVNVIPGAFSSLASIADGLDQYKETVKLDEESELIEFVVTSEKTLVNNGEAVALNWEKSNTHGSYVFTYDCKDGVSVDIRENGDDKSIDCNTNYNIGNQNNLSILVDSEKERYALIKYSISFLKTDSETPSASAKSNLTVFNNAVSDTFVTDDTGETEVEVVTPVEITTEDGNLTEAPTTPTTETPTYTQEFTYTIPASDPNGKTDLSIKFLDTGTLVGKTFFAGQIKTEEEGAVQFEVKNYGTKTSKEWTYSLTLPNGSTYKSDKQSPLKPNERATITIGFPTTEDTTHTFKGIVKDLSDVNSINNQFSQAVTFIE